MLKVGISANTMKAATRLYTRPTTVTPRLSHSLATYSNAAIRSAWLPRTSDTSQYTTSRFGDGFHKGLGRDRFSLLARQGSSQASTQRRERVEERKEKEEGKEDEEGKKEGKEKRETLTRLVTRTVLSSVTNAWIAIYAYKKGKEYDREYRSTFGGTTGFKNAEGEKEGFLKELGRTLVGVYRKIGKDIVGIVGIVS